MPLPPSEARGRLGPASSGQRYSSNQPSPKSGPHLTWRVEIRLPTLYLRLDKPSYHAPDRKRRHLGPLWACPSPPRLSRIEQFSAVNKSGHIIRHRSSQAVLMPGWSVRREPATPSRTNSSSRMVALVLAQILPPSERPVGSRRDKSSGERRKGDPGSPGSWSLAAQCGRHHATSPARRGYSPDRRRGHRPPTRSSVRSAVRALTSQQELENLGQTDPLRLFK